MDFLHSYYRIKKTISHEREIEKLIEEQALLNKGKQIQYYNWWQYDSHSSWLQDFIIKRGLLSNSKKSVALCSVFGEKEVLYRIDADIRIFFSGENLHTNQLSQYADYMLSGKNTFDMGLGFDSFESDRYIRFPLWLTYMFAPDSSDDDIRVKCEQINHPAIRLKTKFSSLISRADWNGVRKEMYDSISKINSVDCPSVFMHNDDSLRENFNNNKNEYLRQYKFNICPENSKAYGYVTEKLYEAVLSGCIPIYWGSDTVDILNPNAIIFWTKGAENKDSLELIKNINSSEVLFEEFASQPRLLSNATDFVIDKFNQLENNLRSILK